MFKRTRKSDEDFDRIFTGNLVKRDKIFAGFLIAFAIMYFGTLIYFCILVSLPKAPSPAWFVPHELKGSAFAIKKTKNYIYYLTNYHVCADYSKKRYDHYQRFKGQKIHYIKSNASYDLCLFKIRNVKKLYNVKVYKLSLKTPIKDQIYENYCFYHSRIFYIIFNKIDTDGIHVYDRAIIHGCSGSPVLNQRQHVIGMVFAIGAFTDYTYVIPSQYIVKFLKSKKSSYEEIYF